MNSDRETFYRERDRRTVDFGVAPQPLEQAVRIAVGDQDASTAAGQAAILALVNMAARVHRHIELEIPSAPLLAPALVEAADLPTACHDLVRAIDPFIQLEIAERLPAKDVPSVGIGPDTVSPCHLYVGARGWRATLTDSPEDLGETRGSIMGSGLAAVLGAAGLLQLAFGHHPQARRVSLWKFGDGKAAEVGPEDNPGPLDVGDVLVVGAGAVASGFFYWCRELGLSGKWEVTDGDRVVLHNTNRAMTFLARDAGWPDGKPQGLGVMKVQAVAPGLDVHGFSGWYANWLSANGDRRPDLVLPLANDFDVRTAIGQRGENLLLHASTSPSWSAQLHRHIAGRDDCIDCRLPSELNVHFDCSEGPLPPTPDVDSASDAALPFLSAGAGLLLTAGLLQLQMGDLIALPHNHWRLLLNLGPRRTLQAGIHACRDECRRVLSPAVRRVVNAGRRWADIANST